jgi:predicted PurR-regulated permease PerM
VTAAKKPAPASQEQVGTPIRLHNPFQIGLIGTLGVGLGILLILAVSSLATILTYIGAALFLALGLDPAIDWLEKKRFPRWAAILTVVVVVLAVVAGLLVSVIPLIVEQVSAFITGLPAFLDSLVHSTWIADLTRTFGGVIDFNALLLEISKFLSDPANISKILGGALNIGIGIANGFFGVIIVVILTLYFTASLKLIKHNTYKLVPASKRPRFIELSEQITHGVGRYVIGQVLLALVDGVLTFIFLTAIGGKAAIVFAFIAFLLSLIPLIGTLSASIIIVLSQLITAGPLTALVAAIYYLIYMQVEAYVLSPRIMNKAVSVPGSIVVIAALAGGALLGILGALIAIPVAASIILIVKDVFMPLQEKR